MVACLLAGAAYYLLAPKKYEAFATIQLAMVAGELVEAPAALLEKIKLPLFFSAATMQACGSERGLSTDNKFADKLKPTLNKSAPLIAFSAQGYSSQEARACLETVISEIQKSQNELARPLIEQKKQKLAQLTSQLKLAEDMTKSFPVVTKPGVNVSDVQFSTHSLVMSSALVNATEMSDLRHQINILEAELIPYQTRPASLAAPVYAPKASNHSHLWFALGLCLMWGVFLGLLITGMQRKMPEIRRQMREAEAKGF